MLSLLNQELVQNITCLEFSHNRNYGVYLLRQIIALIKGMFFNPTKPKLYSYQLHSVWVHHANTIRQMYPGQSTTYGISMYRYWSTELSSYYYVVPDKQENTQDGNSSH